MSSSSIADVVTSVQARYEADSGDSSVAWYYGARHLSQARGWPRVVAVRTSAVYEVIDGSSSRLGVSAEDRVVYLRRSRVDWHCWGGSDAAAEVLATSVVLVLRRLYGDRSRTFRPLSESWSSEVGQTMHDGGALVVLSTDLVFEVTDEVVALPITEPATIAHVGLFDGDEVC